MAQRIGSINKHMKVTISLKSNHTTNFGKENFTKIIASSMMDN